jgi:hypothetical protein
MPLSVASIMTVVNALGSALSAWHWELFNTLFSLEQFIQLRNKKQQTRQRARLVSCICFDGSEQKRRQNQTGQKVTRAENKTEQLKIHSFNHIMRS